MNRKEIKEKAIRFFKRETVLCVAAALALFSMLFAWPDREYLNYIDFRTLAVLFCLMGIMSGLQETCAFQWIAQVLLGRVKKVRQLVLILVLLCFFSAMLLTNDVALITFVPFTFIVLAMLGSKVQKRLVIPVVVLQTLAANLGSMLTPVGNPQNLYLYGKSGLPLIDFMLLTLPYTLLALLLIVICCLLHTKSCNTPIKVAFERKAKITATPVQLLVYGLLFALVLLTVARLVPYKVTLALTVSGLLLVNIKSFRHIDYSLLFIFVGFFIFIGNLGRLPAFHLILQRLVAGHELISAVAASQFISNVPAALLLSGFTNNYVPLIIGVNLGGLGTLIASMASLISYKIVARQDSSIKGAYFRYFTTLSVGFLAVLLLFAFLLGV